MNDKRDARDPADEAAERLAREAGARLRASADGLDAATRSRLNQARQRALDELRPRRRAAPWLWPAAATAAVATLAVSLLLPGRLPPAVDDLATPGPAVVADLEILLPGEAPADLEMMEDLEFYAWLDEGRSPEELRAELDGVG
jgi:hypothetical protein